MGIRRKAKASVATVAMLFLFIVACSASSAKAEGIAPVEGGWVAITSVGLPVSFEVKEGNVLNAHFGFNWGYCGAYESSLPNTDPIDGSGHWSFDDPRGQTIKATFVAPDRAEGTVVAVERELPSCPHTHATFIAAPGDVPPYVKPQIFTVQNTYTGHLSRHPSEIILAKNASFAFYGLQWKGYGKPKAYAAGWAGIHRGQRRWRPRASVRLSSLVEDEPGKWVYSRLRYVLHGPVPSGFGHQGSLVVP